ncbi:MAG: restriction endonuclease subunit S [Nitrosospira multiformis]|nr:restriction endonuclease subunit S [Nitrosospira multiformis]
MKAGWSVKPLSEVCVFQRGLTYAKTDEVEVSNNIVLRATNIDLRTNLLDLEELKYINDSVVASASKKVKKNSLLICTASGSKSHLGKVAFIDNDYDFAFGGFMGMLTPNESVLPRYFFHLMTSGAYKDFIAALSDGANINNLKFSDLGQFSVPVPPLHEQHRIVTILDEAFDGIANATANAEKNFQNARALFESVLDSIQGENAPLGNYVSIKTGKLDANAATENGAYPFFTCAKEIYAIDNYAFDLEAILLAGNNAVGDFNVKHYKGKFNAYQRTYVITIADERRLSYRFLYFQMLKSLRRFKEQSLGAGTKFLKLGMIKDLEISLPLIAKQVEIASMLDSLLDETQRLESIYQQKLTALDDLKKSLLHQAFSGKL